VGFRLATTVSIDDATFGTDIQTTVTLENTVSAGGKTATDTIQFSITDSTGTVIRSSSTNSITLDPGQTQTQTFTGPQLTPSGSETYTAEATFDSQTDTDQTTVTEPAEPTIQTTIDTASFGQDMETTVTVENTVPAGGESVTDTIQFTVTDSTGSQLKSATSAQITLNPGESQTKTFTGPTLNPSGSEAYTAEATFAGETQTETATVVEPAQLSLDDVTLTNPSFGNTLVTNITVSNDASAGGESGTGTIQYALAYDGNTRDENGQTVSLAPEEKQTISFTGVDADESGTYTAKATFAGQQQQDTAEITQPPSVSLDMVCIRGPETRRGECGECGSRRSVREPWETWTGAG
jgi:hypothetical protein